jgi:ribosomal protein S14
MKYIIKNILREKLTRKRLTEANSLLNIIRSIRQNNNVNNSVKIYANYILEKRAYKNCMVSRKHRICLYTGKRSGVLKGFNFSRYTVKGLILRNKLTNLKQHNW